MIIFTHHSGESHGILGAQVAATFLHRKLSIHSIVVGIERNFSKEQLLRFIGEHYEKQEKIAAFSHLCGRADLIDLAREMKEDGFTTVLGGPQARQDYSGEPDTDSFPHRFKGLNSIVDVAFQGPVDSLILEDLGGKRRLLDYPWTRDISLEVDWSNLYTFSEGLRHVDVRLGQVLSTIGCAYACKRQTIVLPVPVNLQERGDVPELEVKSQGCIFCDVSRDKGYHGTVETEKLILQMAALPEVDGRKIPFELIDEYPIRSLGKLIEEAERHGIELSQINLVCRVDDINAHSADLEEALSLAQRRDIKVMFASIGFESFSDRLLRYLCKGITVAENVRCVETLRRMKDRFGSHLLYRRDEGANHGFIRPTPWDDGETMREMDRTIFLHRLFEDILPDHSTPLIIHHASYLGDWIRQIESTTGTTFGRVGTWIEWWNPLPQGERRMPAEGR